MRLSIRRRKKIYQIDNKLSSKVNENFSKNKIYYIIKSYDILLVNIVGIKSISDQCIDVFSSQSALHKYIRTRCILPQEAIVETGSSLSFTRPILKSTTKLTALDSSLTFKDWNYATPSIIFDPTVLLSLTNPDSFVYLDKGYGVTLVDKTWLAKKPSSQKISVMLVFLKIKGIVTLKHELKDIVFTTIYILNINKESREVYISINYKLHLLDRLRANILVDNDMFCIESFAINFSTSSTLIHSCNMKININIR